MSVGATVIGIDARAASEVPAGRGRVVRELLRTLAARPDDGRRYVLYARSKWGEEYLDRRFSWRLIDVPDPLWHMLAARSANRDCQVFLSTNSYLTLWFLRIPGVPIVYDMLAFDRRMHPNRRSALVERLTLGLAVRRAAGFVAISQATADALAKRSPAAGPRTSVALLGGSLPEQSLGADQLSSLPEPGFVLAVGTLEPRKNLPRLVAGFVRLDPELRRGHPLVVVGALGWQAGETLSSIKALGDEAQLLDYVSDSALRELYRRCAVFCYPSLGEGFGLPVLEAMEQGAPVLASDIAPLHEVSGQAAVYVDPLSVESIAEGLERVISDPRLRERMAAEGRARARRFSWEDFAERVLEALQRASTRS